MCPLCTLVGGVRYLGGELASPLVIDWCHTTGSVHCASLWSVELCPSVVFRALLSLVNVPDAPAMVGTALYITPSRWNHFLLEICMDLGGMPSSSLISLYLLACGKVRIWWTVLICHPCTIFLALPSALPFTKFFIEMGFSLALSVNCRVWTIIWWTEKDGVSYGFALMVLYGLLQWSHPDIPPCAPVPPSARDWGGSSRLHLRSLYYLPMCCPFPVVVFLPMSTEVVMVPDHINT